MNCLSVFDHFAMQQESKTTFICKIVFNTELIESFKKKLYDTDCEETETSKTPGEA